LIVEYLIQDSSAKIRENQERTSKGSDSALEMRKKIRASAFCTSIPDNLLARLWEQTHDNEISEIPGAQTGKRRKEGNENQAWS
jgi:hypothetical protein